MKRVVIFILLVILLSSVASAGVFEFITGNAVKQDVNKCGNGICSFGERILSKCPQDCDPFYSGRVLEEGECYDFGFEELDGSYERMVRIYENFKDNEDAEQIAENLNEELNSIFLNTFLDSMDPEQLMLYTIEQLVIENQDYLPPGAPSSLDELDSLEYYFEPPEDMFNHDGVDTDFGIFNHFNNNKASKTEAYMTFRYSLYAIDTDFDFMVDIEKGNKRIYGTGYINPIYSSLLYLVKSYPISAREGTKPIKDLDIVKEQLAFMAGQFNYDDEMTPEFVTEEELVIFVHFDEMIYEDAEITIDLLNFISDPYRIEVQNIYHTILNLEGQNFDELDEEINRIFEYSLMTRLQYENIDIGFREPYIAQIDSRNEMIRVCVPELGVTPDIVEQDFEVEAESPVKKLISKILNR
ncbi:hypothetical protein CL616_00480 [archaeon]|nr:hypothetical protein [archaeon]